ncbi:hypothetical protein [Rickettsia endosymbiont of Cantharis rufa]|uniref:hypothetical protein n=1 Tax=Rickettsia endosymbiont of Cantharis rufa TaxID=3066248 RepID=UPI003132A2CB
MPAPVDDIEEKIEQTSFILDNYERLCLIDREKVNNYLHIISNNLAELLDKKMPLSIGYFHSIVQLIESFNKINIIIPQELNNALCNTLLNFEHNNYSEGLQEIVIQYIEILDILGAHAYE